MKKIKENLSVIVKIIVISIITLGIIKWYKTAEINWTYLKYNNNLYALDTYKAIEEPLDETKLSRLGQVDKEVPIFIKPNNVSNGLPRGTEIYTLIKTSDKYEVIVKFKNKFYTLVNIEHVEGWGNGVKARLY